MTRTLLIKGATMLADPGSEPDRADVLIDGDTITATGPEATVAADRAGAEIMDAAGLMLMPGLVNAHTHSPLSPVQGAYDTLNHRSCMWLFQAYTKNRTPEEVYLSALKNASEMLLSGTTAVIDHFPEQNFEIEDVEAVVRAYHDAGLRAVVALRIFDGEYSDIFPVRGQLDETLLSDLHHNNPLQPRPLAETRALCEEAIRRFDGLDDGMIRIFPAPSNPMRCSDDLLEMCVELRDRHDVGIHCHLLETYIQTEIAQKLYGCTMVQHLDRLGLLDHRFSSAHTIWLGEEDVALLAERGGVPVHNPESNSRGGSGIMPTPAMRDAGVEIAIGSDGSCSGGAQFLQRAMYLATMLHRTPDTPPGARVTARDALRMGTLGGAKAMLGEGRFGRIAAGQKADLALYRIAGHHWERTVDPVASFVSQESGQSLVASMANGRWLVRDGSIASFDWDAARTAFTEALPGMRARNADLFDLTGRLSDAVLRGGQGPLVANRPA